MDAVDRAVLAQCRVLEFPAPWDFLGPSEFGFRGPADSGRAIAALRAAFEDELLIARRVAVRAADGTAILSPDFGPHAVLATVSDQLIVDSRCNGGAALVAFVGSDFKPTLCRSDVFFATSLAEAALLRTLGLKAAPSSCLVNLDQHGVDFLRQFRIERRGPSTGPRRGKTKHMKIVGWSPLALTRDLGETAQAAIADFDALVTHRGLRTDDVCVWCPTTQDLGHIQYALGRRNRSWLRDALVGSIASMTQYRSSLDPAAAAPTGVATLGLKMAEFGKPGPQDWTGRNRPEQLRREYNELVDQEMIGPLLAAAAAAQSPVVRIANAETAIVAKTFFSMAPTVVTKLATTAIGEELPASVAADVKQLLAVADAMRRAVANVCQLASDPWVLASRRFVR